MERCVYPHPLPRGWRPSWAEGLGREAVEDLQRLAAISTSVNLLWKPETVMPVTRTESHNLILFFRQHTCHSFSIPLGTEGPSSRILRDISIQASYLVPFFRSSIIAMAAMHMESLNMGISPHIAYVARERSYTGYREAINQANSSKFPSLIVNSLMLTAISSFHFRDCRYPELYILDWMNVWRGIGIMMDFGSRQTVTDRGLEPLFERPVMDQNSSGEGIPLQLKYMKLGIGARSDPDTGDRDVYTETLNKLGVLFRNLKQGLTDTMCRQIVTWLTMIPSRFIEIARQKRPRALIILAYYAAFLKLLQGAWWLAGVGDRIIFDVVKELDVQWQVYLHMPRLAKKADGNIAVGRAILNSHTWLPDPRPVLPANTTSAADDAEMLG